MRKLSLWMLVVGVAALGPSLGCKNSKSQSKGSAGATAGGNKSATSPPVKAITASPTARQALGKKACALVSKADAAAAVGEPVKAGVPKDVRCEFDAVSGDDNLVVEFRNSGVQGFYKQAKNLSAQMVGKDGPKPEDVSGVGDQAFITTRPIKSIVLIADGKYVQIGGLISGKGFKDRLTALGKKVAAKL